MAQAKSPQDRFANLASLLTTETGANTLTFSKLQLSTPLMQTKSAMVLHRAEYYFYTADMQTNLNGTGDEVNAALTISSSLTSLNPSQAEVLDKVTLVRIDYGVAASGLIVNMPFVKDFTNLPGGGLLIPADTLALGVYGVGCAGANSVQCRLYYTILELSPSDYWDLVEARRIMSV